MVKALFFDLLESMPDAMIAVDREGRIVTANTQTEKLFGYAREELIEQPVEILMPERFRAAHRSHLAKYFNEPGTRSMISGRELCARRKDGTEISVDIMLTPLETEEGFWAISAIREITERKQAEQRLQDRYRHLQALYSLAAVVNQSLDIDFVLRSAMHKILEIFGFHAARIFLLSEDGQAWQRVVNEGTEEIAVPVPQLIPGGISALVLKTGKPIFFEDVQNDAEYDRLASSKSARRLGFRGCFWFPIRAKDNIVGVMGFLSKRPYLFSSGDVELTHAITDQVGTAVENARLHERALLQMKRLDALRKLNLATTSSLRLHTVLNLLLEKVDFFFPDSALTVRLHNEGTGKLELAACCNIDKEVWRAHQLKFGHRYALSAIIRETKVPLVVNKVKNDPRMADPEFLKEQGIIAFLGIPLIAKGEFLGILTIYTRKEHKWAKDEVEFFRTAAGEAAVAVYNARLYEEILRGRTALRVLSHRLIEAQEAERRHIARELHDEVGQELTALMLKLSMSEQIVSKEAAEVIAQARLGIKTLMKRVRSLSLDLRPSMLDDLGLVPALLWHFERYTNQTGVRVNFQHRGVERRSNLEVETAAYRIVQEALTNVARHAGVEEAEVKVYANQEGLRIRIKDHGSGFNPSLDSGRGVGISGMEERARLLGGRLIVESAVGRGTSVLAELPLKEGNGEI